MGDFFAELIQRHVTRVALGVLFAAALWPAPAKEATNARSAVPDFSSNDVSWEGVGSEFMPPASGPGPVMSDKAHPYVPNNTGKQPTFRVADLNNPILKPWVIEELRKANQRVLAGAAMFTRDARCWTPGVPAFLLDPGQLYFIQTPKEVLLIAHDDHRVRRIYLDVPHSKNLKPSWDGESIGHYEGDTLVVDTIGLNDKTLIDYYRTPHTTALHVVERFRLIEEGKTLQVDVTIDDPGAFNTRWSAVRQFRRVLLGPLPEKACAENNQNYFNYDVEPLPQADKPDF